MTLAAPLRDEDRLAHHRRDAGGQPYEWWYFEFHFSAPPAHDPDAAPDDWVFVVSCHAPHAMDPVRMLDVALAGNVEGEGGHRSHHPFAYSGVATSIYRLTPGEPLLDSLVGFAVTRNAAASVAHGEDGDRFHASFGVDGQTLQIEEEASAPSEPRRYRLRLRQRGWWGARGLVGPTVAGRKPRRLDVELDVVFTERSPGFRLGEGEIMRDRFGTTHHWAVVFPDPRVTGRARLKADGHRAFEADAIDSLGYHDHQWGHRLPMHVMREWSWGRLLVKSSPDADGRGSDARVGMMTFFETHPVAHAGGDGPERGRELFGYSPIDISLPTRELEARPSQERVKLGEWDPNNYPLRGYMSLPVATPSGRPASGGGGSPPADDTQAPGWLRGVCARAALPLMRWLMRDTVGYYAGLTACARDTEDPRGPVLRADARQRGTTVEPWPFYNRYIPLFDVARSWSDVRQPLHVEFGLAEFMEVSELVEGRVAPFGDGKLPFTLAGIAAFSEFITDIEPGAPKFWDLRSHMWAS